jgi:putative hemolysin
MRLLIVLLLIVLNGLFAMAEISVISTRKSKVQKEANEGNKSAQAVVELKKNTNRFLSTVQIGITFIGIFIGAFGGDSMAATVSHNLKTIPFLAPYSDPVSLFLVVVFITYLTLIIGELVPKRLALTRPESIAKKIAPFMSGISLLTSPLVSFLTFSSDWVIRLLQIKPSNEPTVSEEEVKMLIQEGTTTGVFNRAENDIVVRTFQLDDKKIVSLMTPRKEIAWLDKENSFEELRAMIVKNPHSYFPICEGSMDKVLGIIRTEDILTSFLVDEKIDLKKAFHKPIFVPETMEALTVLEVFKKTGVHMALVVDEYGSVLGLLSLADILEEIVGDIPDMHELEEQEIVKKEDGSFQVDGLLPIDEFKEYFKIATLPDEQADAFYTVGGFVMAKLDSIPKNGDTFEFDELHVEVIDMDGNRVNKILISPIKDTSSE